MRIARCMIARFAALGLLTGILAAGPTGCGARVKHVDTAAGLDGAALSSGRIAIGGVLLGPLAELDRAAAFPDGSTPGVIGQSERWAPVLYREFIAVRPDLECWPFAAAAAEAPAEVFVPVAEDWAAGRTVLPERIRELGAGLAGAAYLALARIDGTEISSEQDFEAAQAGQRSRDGRDVHAASLNRSYRTRRKVTASLELFDLASGRSVWFGTADAARQQLFDPAKAAVGDVKEEGAEPEALQVTGPPLAAPELDDVLGEALGVLIGRLPTSP